jgi:hypothetical protein
MPPPPCGPLVHLRRLTCFIGRREWPTSHHHSHVTLLSDTVGICSLLRTATNPDTNLRWNRCRRRSRAAAHRQLPRWVQVLLLTPLKSVLLQLFYSVTTNAAGLGLNSNLGQWSTSWAWSYICSWASSPEKGWWWVIPWHLPPERS